MHPVHLGAVVRTRVLIALAAALLGATVLVGCGVPLPPGCTQVRIFVTRETSAPAGSSYLLMGVVQQLQASYPGTSDVVHTDYPASYDFLNSVNAGVSALSANVTQAATTCPGQQFVLLGYSQGAWVVGNVLSSLKANSGVVAGVKAVVLYGDPLFNAAEPYDRGTFAPGVNGVLKRPTGDLAAFASTLRSYCTAGDGVCQANGGAVQINAQHLSYIGSPAVADGATFARSKLT